PAHLTLRTTLRTSFFLRIRPPPRPTLFPYTTLFRSWDRHDLRRARVAYLAELAARRKEDGAWYNAGTAALADSDAETAQASLARSEEHTSELQSRFDLVCRLLLEKKNKSAICMCYFN